MTAFAEPAKIESHLHQSDNLTIYKILENTTGKQMYQSWRGTECPKKVIHAMRNEDMKRQETIRTISKQVSKAKQETGRQGVTWQAPVTAKRQARRQIHRSQNPRETFWGKTRDFIPASNRQVKGDNWADRKIAQARTTAKWREAGHTF